MASINASTTGAGGVITTADATGVLELQAAGTTVARVSSGNLQFNSGYGSVATAFGCRAWVNFNGTGTVSIRASGNVSSITDGGTGRYTINFTTAMPDANYSINGNYNGNYGSSNVYLYAMAINSFLSGNMTESAPLTTSCEISTYSQAGSTDFKYVNVSIHR